MQNEFDGTPVADLAGAAICIAEAVAANVAGGRTANPADFCPGCLPRFIKELTAAAPIKTSDM
jgi:hypothetical protein